MIALISFLVLIAVFLTAARAATVVLEVTGMDRQAAEFQARSALMGVGFTTLESEAITNHPVRRRLVLWLMTFGNAGVITGIGSFIIAFGDAPALQTLLRSGELLAGAVLLLISVHVSAANRLIARVTRAALRRFTSLEISNLTILLPRGGRWVVAELRVERDSGLDGRSFTDLDLRGHDISVLGVRRRDGTYIGSPAEATRLALGDVVTLYGRIAQLTALARPRPSGAPVSGAGAPETDESAGPVSSAR
ncbi:MAG: TrkA C-terminal domain-containing protein [Acidimicrobiales bacterium]